MNNFKMIAPCGINCSLCIGHLRDKKKCPGCLSKDNDLKPVYCVSCRIKCCKEHNNKKFIYCYDCIKFPCQRIKNLNKRYSLKYHTSNIENLNYIKEKGIKAFYEYDKLRHLCKNCGSLTSVHRNQCLKCGKELY
ncbi:MAG: DUF3795 domain-containing protein [Bacilli bacterium]|nr:DUF3795 domain-containing protein [Bacilli bacterium]